jgi:outer membrane protein OmpA-like peptidoglycan-associated protein
MNYRLLSIFLCLLISGCASTQSISPAVLDPSLQQEDLLNSLNAGGVRRIQVGDELRLILPQRRFFIQNTTHLKVSAYPVLSQIVTLLNQQKNFGIEVLAYTPSADLQQQTTDLAQLQARAIEEYLLQQGLNTRLIVARAWDSHHQACRKGVRFMQDPVQIFCIEIRTRHLHTEDSD